MTGNEGNQNDVVITTATPDNVPVTPSNNQYLFEHILYSPNFPSYVSVEDDMFLPRYISVGGKTVMKSLLTDASEQ